MLSELILLLAIFVLCVFLALEDLRSAFIFLLLVSPLLHKEVFSLVKWDLLPIRIVMVALIAASTFKFLMWLRQKKDFSRVRFYIRDPMFVLLVSLLFVRLISLMNSKNIQASLLILAFYSTVVFLYILLSYLAHRYGEKFILSGIKFYSFIAFGTALIALLQFYLDSRFGIIFGALWRIPGRLSRVGSVFWDVNHYAGYLSSIIPVSIGLFLTARSKTAKFLYGFMSVFMFVILLLTNSRSAWVGFFVSMSVFGLYLLVKRFGLKSVLYVFISAAVVFLSGLRVYQDRDSLLREKINSYFHYRGDSFASHFLLLAGAYEVFTKYPLLGGGYGSFFEHFKDTSVAAQYYGRDPAALSVRVPAHSVWFEVLSETGIVGMSIFTAVVLFTLGTILYASRLYRHESKGILLFALGASVIGYLVSGIFYSYNAEFFWIVIFLAFVFAKSSLDSSYSLTQILDYLKNNSYIHLSVIGVLAFLMIFLNLGVNSLIPWDEAIYGKISKNMLTSGNVFDLTWDSEDSWYEKPPLYMWLSAFTMSLIGISELSVRLPSAVFGVLSVLLTFILGRLLFNRLTGFLSAVILLTIVHFMYYSRVGMLDVTLTFFFLSSLISYLLAVRRKSLGFWVASGALAGLGFMTKGVVGLLIIPMIGVSEFYFRKSLLDETRGRRIKHYFYWVLSFTLIALPWHVYMLVRHGSDFIETYFGYHAFKRATESIEGKGQPFFWYIIVMRVSMRIWFAALILDLLAGILNRVLGSFKEIYEVTSKYVKSVSGERNGILLYLWTAVIFLFFSSSVSKLVWYIIPLYPLVAVITARFFTLNFENLYSLTRRSLFHPALLAYLVMAGGISYFFFVRDLVYVSDLTGPQAHLVTMKDEILGTDLILYYDRLEKPIPLFYSNGPIEGVDFTPLKEKIEESDFADTFAFITKESRYTKLKALYPGRIDTIGEEGDFFLGSLRSTEQILTSEIKEVESEIAWIESESLKSNPLAIGKLLELPGWRRYLECVNAAREARNENFILGTTCQRPFSRAE